LLTTVLEGSLPFPLLTICHEPGRALRVPLAFLAENKWGFHFFFHFFLPRRLLKSVARVHTMRLLLTPGIPVSSLGHVRFYPSLFHSDERQPVRASPHDMLHVVLDTRVFFLSEFFRDPIPRDGDYVHFLSVGLTSRSIRLCIVPGDVAFSGLPLAYRLPPPTNCFYP